MAKQNGGGDILYKRILDEMVRERGEPIEMEVHWQKARQALGQARWHCQKRDVSPEIAEMRRELASERMTLRHIGTSEDEITELLLYNRRAHGPNPAKAAQSFAISVARYLQSENLRSARMALTQLERNLTEANLDLAAVGVTQAQYEAWCAKLRPPKKGGQKRPES